MRLGGRLLCAIVPIVVLALVTLGAVAYEQLKGPATADLNRQSALLLEQSEREWQNLVDTLHANTQLFASSDLIERYALTDDEGERIDLLQPGLLKLFASYQRAYPEYREIRFLLPDGYEDTRLTRGTLANLTEEEGDSAWFRALRDATRGGRTEYLRFGWSPDDQAPVLLAGRAMRLADRNRSSFTATASLRGYFTVSADVSAFADAISLQRIGRRGRVVVLDGAGRPVGRSSRAAPAALIDSLQAGLDAARQGDASHRVQLADEHYLVRQLTLNGGLSVHAVVSAVELASARRSLVLSIGAMAVLSTLAVTALLFLVLRSVVLEPLAALAQAARAIGEGRLDAPPRLARRDEIGELSDAFADMSGALADSMRELTRSHDRIEQLAFTDSLTGLPNRRAFLDLADTALNARSTTGRAAILFLDLDGFKRINDTMGHEAGDQLLVAISERLQHAMTARASKGPIARLGGDEFTVLLRDADEADALATADSILAELRVPVTLGERQLVVGTSIGIALFPNDGAEAVELLKCADVAMYDAKRSGPNRRRLYGHAMREGLERHMELESELRRAVEQERLSLDFQPQYDLSSGRMLGCEALLRWRHPELGFVSPADFIPVAETSGLIVPIGDWVLEEACRQWSRWQRQGIAPARIAVNVSQRQFANGGVVDLVERALRRYDVPAEALELELTESCMMEAEAEVVESLGRLRERGVRIAMDDFGTGYSSLAALTQLPIDTLKIDRSFVTGIRAESPNEKVVSAILTLARGLDLEIVAEGVETDAELAFLREKACDIVQGYLLSRPLPVEAMSALLLGEHGPALAA